MLLYVTVDFISTLHLSYAKFIRQHEIKSSTRENGAFERHGKHKIHEAAAA